MCYRVGEGLVVETTKKLNKNLEHVVKYISMIYKKIVPTVSQFNVK